MNIQEILAIAGKPGLFKVIASGTVSIVVESLMDGKRSSVPGAARNTAYDVYVRQVCSGPTYSANAGPATFYTGYCVPSSSTSSWNREYFLRTLI